MNRCICTGWTGNYHQLRLSPDKFCRDFCSKRPKVRTLRHCRWSMSELVTSSCWFFLNHRSTQSQSTRFYPVWWSFLVLCYFWGTQLIARLKIVLVHVFANYVVRVFFALVDAVYRLVCSLLLVAGLFSFIFVGCWTDNWELDTERF